MDYVSGQQNLGIELNYGTTRYFSLSNTPITGTSISIRTIGPDGSTVGTSLSFTAGTNGTRTTGWGISVTYTSPKSFSATTTNSSYSESGPYLDRATYYYTYKYDITASTATYSSSGSSSSSSGGSVSPTSQSIVDGNTFSITATASSGYTFKGWVTSAGSSIPTSFISTSSTLSGTATSDTGYIAVFQENAPVVTYYTITAYAGTSGGSVSPSSQSKTYGSTATIYATANSGYRFVGWRRYGSSTYVSTSSTYSFTVTGSAIYYADFEEDDVTVYTNIVIRNASGSSIYSGSNYRTRINNTQDSYATVRYGESVTIDFITSEALSNYSFKGWTTSTTATTYVSTSTTYNFNAYSNSTYYAIIELDKYTISASAVLRANGSSTISTVGGTVNPTSQSVYLNSTALISSAANSGYRFVGWTSDKDSTEYDSTDASYSPVVVNTKTYYAIFVDSSVPTISISSTNDMLSTQTVTLNATDNIGVTGYYWGTDPEGSEFIPITSTTNWTKTVVVDEPGSYYLFVTDNDNNVSSLSRTYYQTIFNPVNGTCSTPVILTMSGNSIVMPNVVPNPGYQPATQWKHSTDTYSIGSSYTPINNITFTGVCNGNTYYVRYNKNSELAIGTMADSEHTYGLSQKLSLNEFYDPNYSFASWNTEPDGSGSRYPNGADVTGLTTVQNGMVILYAQWVHRANIYSEFKHKIYYMGGGFPQHYWEDVSE